MAVGEVEAIARRQDGRSVARAALARAWSFYFAHRPLIVLGMAGYLAVIHLVAFGLFWTSNWPGVIAWHLGLGSRWVEFDSAFRNRSGVLRRRAAVMEPGGVLFVGDSQLALMDIGALTDRAVQLSIPGDTARRVANRIDDYALHGARLILIHVGTNDLRFRTPEEMRRPFARILRTVPARTPVILSGILPVDEAVFGRYGNEEVRAANAVIAQACASRPGCTFLDFGATVADATGGLDPRYHRGDGLHLNADGYRVWRAALKPVLEPWRSL